MKKFFTLVSLALCAVLGMQAELMDSSKIKFEGVNPAYKQALAKKYTRSELLELSETNPSMVQRKAWQSGTFIWEAYFQRMGKLSEVLELRGEDNEILDHQDYPFYAARMIFYRYRQGEDIRSYNTEIDCLISWPTYRTWKDTDLNPALSLDYVALDDFISSPNTIKTFQWNNFSNPSANLAPSVNAQGQITSFPIWSNIMGDVFSTYNGVDKLTLTSSGTRVSRFTLESYDEEEDDTMLIPFDFYFSNNTSTSGRYNGPVELFDWIIEERTLDLTNLHMFNVGVISSNTMPNDYDMPYNFPELGVDSYWGPVKQFYMYGVSKNASLVIDSQDIAVPFDSQKLKISFTGEPESVDFMHGALFCETSVEKPYEYKWFLVQPKEWYDPLFDMTFWLMQPEPHTMVPSGLDKESYVWSLTDGMTVCYQGIERNPYQMAVVNGSTEGFLIDGVDIAENTYLCEEFKGKIIYHYDPKDMRLTEELESVGNYEYTGVSTVASEENALVTVANGAINVVAANGAEVAIFTLDGARVAAAHVNAGETYTFNGANGLYIVKVGKTACKVML